MLSIASTKIEKKKYTGLIKLIKGDAQEMSLSSNYYDKVSMSFGIRNVPDRMKALKEIFRVMSPNGKVIIMEFSTPLSGFLTPVTKFFLHYVMPTIGMYIYIYICISYIYINIHIYIHTYIHIHP
jgi:demethylmenaquinone methyltransferase/2-methoxy-6-polyprenyl-1,4-benzoquinol methylase